MIWNVLEPQDSVTSNSFRCCIDTLHLLSSYNCLCQRMRWSSLGWLRYSQGFVTRHIQDLIPWHIYNYLPSALNDFAYDGADFAVNRKTAHRAKSVQQAEQHQFQMSFFIEPKESSTCATQACQRSLAFFPDSFFLNKFSSQAIAERASVYLSLQGSSWSIARQDFAPPGMVEVVMKQISYRGEIEVYDFVCFLC